MDGDINGSAEAKRTEFEQGLEASFHRFAPGDVVTGIVIGVSDTEVTVDLNSYAEGIIPSEELSADPRFSIKADILPGDEVKAVVLSENRDGAILLSKKQAEQLLSWEELENMKEERTIVTVKIAEAVPAGVVTYLCGVRAFIPASKLALSYVEDTSAFSGKSVEAVVLEADRETGKLVLSVKDVLKEKETEERNSRIARLPVGTVVTGTVEKIMPYGAFVAIGNGLTGLVHVSQICAKRIRSPHEVLREGEQVSVKILDVKEGKISLSMKAVGEKEETAQELSEAPEVYTFGESGGATLGELLKNIKL